MRKTLRTLAAACALAAIATLMPQAASPASAAPVVNAFYQGDIIKMKTTWGGGWVLNFGGSAGSTLEGRIAQIHWNVPTDWNNRFEVFGSGHAEGNRLWFRLKNRYSTLCLTARDVFGGAHVRQYGCNGNADQYWSVYSSSSGTVTIRNLAFQRAGLSMVLTQATPNFVGSSIIMQNPVSPTDFTRQRWIVQTCTPLGPELAEC